VDHDVHGGVPGLSFSLGFVSKLKRKDMPSRDGLPEHGMAEQALIGLLGGMSWESSVEYYRLINEGVRDRLGGVASARTLMWSFDFARIEALQHAGDWDALAGEMAEAARTLQRGGADFLVLCTNTMHRCAGAIEAAVDIPLLHIADPTAAAIQAAGLTKIGLLGTAFTMEQAFYRGRLEETFGLEVLTPDAHDRAAVHDIIYRELVAGQVLDASREIYRAVIQRLVDRGAQGIILGCTEIMLLIGAADSPVPVFDTTTLHAEAAVERALGT
jgi:aspartate racemase